MLGLVCSLPGAELQCSSRYEHYGSISSSRRRSSSGSSSIRRKEIGGEYCYLVHHHSWLKCVCLLFLFLLCFFLFVTVLPFLFSLWYGRRSPALLLIRLQYATCQKDNSEVATGKIPQRQGQRKTGSSTLVDLASADKSARRWHCAAAS